MQYMEFILRPVAALVLFGGAALVAHLIKRLIPEGRLKEILYKKHPIVYVREKQAEAQPSQRVE